MPFSADMAAANEGALRGGHIPGAKSVHWSRAIDPADGTVRVVGKLSHAGEMAFVGRDLYLAGGDKYLIQHNKHLRRIRGIVPPAPAE